MAAQGCIGRGARRQGGAIVGMLALFCAFSVSAEPGLDWLSTQQAPEGSYGDTPASLAGPVPSTAEVLRAQLAFKQSSAPGFDSALGYLGARSGDDTELLARKILVSTGLGIKAPASGVFQNLSQLLSHQSGEGGFGARPGYGPSIFDTSIALEALAAASDLTSPQAVDAVGFLLSRQQASGAWADGANELSVYLTAASMRALWAYRDTYAGVATSLTRAQNFLLSRRGTDGLWGEDFLSAMALLALVPNVGDLSLVESSASALQARQMPNGSWVNDSYTTALALQSLKAYDARRQAPTPVTRGSISGYVVLANSTEPIAGATISVEQLPGVAVLTSGEGYYVIPGLPEGSYTVTARKAGYTPASVVVATHPNQLTLAGNLVLDLVSQTGLVRGLVFDAASRQPLQGVQVSLSGAGDYAVLTDVAGEFEFGPVEPGTYTLRFEKAGYLTLSGAASVVAGRTLSTQLGMTPAGGYVDDAPGSVSGRVVDGKTGEPIAGAMFDLGSGLSGTTGVDGTFSIASVPRATYQGSLGADGYHPATFGLVFSPGASGEVGTLALFPQATTAPPSSLTLRGAVVYGVSGMPIGGANVTLVDTGASAAAGADGRFILSDITLKSFSLAVSASGYVPVTYGIQVSAFGEAEVTLKLSPPGDGATSSELAGVVTDAETGAAVAGAQVTIAGTTLAAVTGNDGSYTLGGIDTLELTLNVSAVGYGQQSLGVKLAAHGQYPLNPTLKPLPGGGFQVVAVAARQAEYPANSTALFTARVASLLSATRVALVLGEVQDGSGTTVATVRPYAEGTTTPASEFTFSAGELKEFTLPWNTAQLAPGAYRLVVRVVEPGTISRAAPFGEILAESAAHTRVVATSAIDGAMAINPPLTQAGLPTPVSFTAFVRNAGNTPLPAGGYVLRVRSAKSGEPLFTAEATVQALAVGENTPISFGTWVPSETGNLPVSVQPLAAGIAGAFSGRLYVGDKASGTFTVDRTVVPEGNHTVRGTIAMQGVDTTLGTSTDPLFTLVKEAVRRGGAYTAAEGAAWNQRNGCLGCHIQTQSLLGLSSAIQKAEIDARATRHLFNAINTSLHPNGSSGGGGKTETTLALWSLSAWGDLTQSFRTQYRSAQYLQGQKSSLSGGRTYWSPSHASGWWDTDIAQTALVVKGFVDVLKRAARLPEGGVPDYALGAARPLGFSPGASEGMATGPDGSLYVVRTGGTITRLDPTTGQTSVAASDLGPIRGLAITSDGTMYVTRYGWAGSIIKIKPDGSRMNLPVSGNIPNAAVGPDGWVYLPDWDGNRVVRVSPADQVEVYLSGGLFNRPHGVAFDSDGNLLVASYYSREILRVAAGSKAVTRFADGLAQAPTTLQRADDGSVYVTTIWPQQGLVRVRPDGTAEQVVSTSANLYGLAVSGGKLFVVDSTAAAVREVEVRSQDTGDLTALRGELPAAARYLLANTDYDYDNVVHAMRLIGLAEARQMITDEALGTQIDAKVASEAALLRSRQKADGGWTRYASFPSTDPLATAMVGIALEYTNPSPTDPQIRNAIQFLLNKQLADGSWDNVSNGLGTRLAATSFVMVFMPKALDRLGGIDIDLYVELPSSIQLSNASTAPATSQPGVGGSMTHLWRLPGVTGAGREVAFDLGLLDMAPGEQRPAATRAYLEFKNSFVDEKVRLPLTVPVVSVTSGMTLAVVTDKAHYLANEPVAITSTVKNTRQAAASGQVALAIRAAGSTEPIAVLPPLPVTGLSGGAQLPLTATWNTGTTLAGGYEVYVRLLDAQGRVLSEGVAPFDISAPAPIASTTVVADRPVYDAWDVASLTGRVRNTAVNAALAASRAELTVESPAGETLYSAIRDVSRLVPGGVVALPFSLKLADAARGSYQVTLVLKDTFTRSVLSTSTTTFQVERHALRSLSGTMTVESPVVYAGNPNTCTDVTQNASASAVAGVKLTHLLVNMDSGEVLDAATELVHLPAGGAEHAYTRSISTAGFALGGYACVLQAEAAGEVRTVASAGFQVVEPPIKVAAHMALGGKGRLLVLLDDAALGADPHGPEAAPKLSTQRAFLEELLTRAGWSNAVTESADDFLREFRTGGYVTYALFSEQEKLSTQAQKLLREAVFRGEGLLVAGAHDSRNHGLYEALGVKFIGHHSHVSEVVLAASEFPLLSGDIQLLTAERPERVERMGAERLGTYGEGDTSLGDALTLHAYGHGVASFSGADLLAIATRDAETSVAAGVLRVLLEHVHPEELALRAGTVVPVQLTVTNQGIAVPTTATVTLPAGVSVVDPGAGVVSGQALVFAFRLAVDEVRTVRFWVRLPEASGPNVVQAIVTAGEGSQATSIPAELMLPTVPLEELDGIQAEIDGLVRSGHSGAQVLKRARSFIGKAAGSAEPALAIHEVLKATDVLAELGDEDMRIVELRVALALWLRWAGLPAN